MSKGALFLALGFLGVCFPVAAQQARHSKTTQHPATTSGVMPLDAVSTLSLFRPNLVSAPNAPLLLHDGPVRAWSDGGQLASETALAQIGMAPLGLFPSAYLAPSDVGAVPTTKLTGVSNSRSEDFAADGKDLPGGMVASPVSNVYYTGEVGFLYGQSTGKGSGDYWESYVWGQAGNDKFHITAGASFDNWDGHGLKFRSFSR